MKEEFNEIAGVELLTPAPIEVRSQFSSQEVDISIQLASVRVHVERVIGLIKKQFRNIARNSSSEIREFFAERVQLFRFMKR